jgi:hypothetical protein
LVDKEPPLNQELLLRRRTIEEARSGSGAGDVAIPPDVRHSWSRCEPAVRASQAAAPLDRADEIGEQWEASPIRRAASHLVEQLRAVAEDGDFVAAITDEDGRILWAWGGRNMRARAEQVNFAAGGRWDERSAGTNALALALVTGRPSTVFSAEHWCDAVRDWVCYSAPVRDGNGRVLGVLDLSSTWDRATPLGLPTVTAMAQLVEHEVRRLPAVGLAEAPVLRLKALGHPTATLGGTPLLATLRQLEILVILAAVGSVGLGELHALLYGDREVSLVTLKAEISQLRRALGGAIGSRPYRLTLPCEADFMELLGRIDGGHLDRATDVYAGQLLPASESPFVIERRHHLDVALRTALLRTGTTAQLLRFAEVHPYDTEVLARAVEVAGLDGRLLPSAVACLSAATAGSA